jgi:uncharacterized phage protein gp47/JayE
MYVLKGSLFCNDNNSVQFVTDKDVIIPITGEITTTVTCTVAGVIGNVKEKTITKIPVSIPGVISVINNNIMHDGFDEESDEALLKRYKVTVRAPATSGRGSWRGAYYPYMEWCRYS